MSVTFKLIFTNSYALISCIFFLSINHPSNTTKYQGKKEKKGDGLEKKDINCVLEKYMEKNL